jgi:hypothetical protein
MNEIIDCVVPLLDIVWYRVLNFFSLIIIKDYSGKMECIESYHGRHFNVSERVAWFRQMNPAEEPD